MNTLRKKLTINDSLSILILIVIFFVISFGGYRYFLKSSHLEIFWPLITLVIYFSLVFIDNVSRTITTRKNYYIIAGFVSMVFLQIIVSVNGFEIFIDNYFGELIFVGILLLLVYLGINQIDLSSINTKVSESGIENKLFNLYYVNFSKMHEIAMLIDNRIMTTIERERIQVKSKKSSGTMSFGKSNLAKAELKNNDEVNLTKRISENFNIKITKSIMLRELYHAIKNSPSVEEEKERNLGRVSIFEEVELNQINMNNTVMLLKVLQDSNFQKSNVEDVEINMNSMVDIMFDDFTIDYTFSQNNKEYLIRFPYNDNENFENGYKHSDFQLGKLSIIGINKGLIDFSKEKNNIASNILEYVSKEYNRKTTQNDKPIIEPSDKNNEESKENKELDFSIEYEKLTGTYELIDVIAVIQELNVGKKSE